MTKSLIGLNLMPSVKIISPNPRFKRYVQTYIYIYVYSVYVDPIYIIYIYKMKG